MDILMTLWVFLIGSIFGIVIGVILSFRTAVSPLQQTMERLTSKQESYQESMKYYPYNPNNFRFIGTPIDGIQFEDDMILFVRFHPDNTPFTTEQNRIKSLIGNKKVGWFDFPIE
jgi:predicted Holliday junction resolvase-like endonuclease